MEELKMKVIEYLCENPVAVDWLWKIVEILAPFVILVITLRDERKQNAKFKKQEVKLQYLSECIKWLNELQIMACTVSRKGFECLCTYNPEEIDKHYKEFNIEASIMCEKCFIGISIYRTVASSFGMTIELEEVRKLTNNFTQTVRENCRAILKGASVGEATDIINGSSQYFEKEIEGKIKEFGKVFSELLQ